MEPNRPGGGTGDGPASRGPTGQGPTGRGPTGRGPTGRGPTGQGPTGQGPGGSDAPGRNTGQFGVLSLILGIASIPLVLCFALSVPAGIAAIILGVLDLRRIRRDGGGNRWPALVGLICGALGLAATAVLIALPD